MGLKSEDLSYDHNREAMSLSITLNAHGEVVRFEKSNTSMIESITCK